MKAERWEAAKLAENLSRQAAQDDASKEAGFIVAQAREEAAALLGRARHKAQQKNDELRMIADAELERFVDRTRVEGAAVALVNVMSAATRLTARFEALEPWLEQLIQTALARMIGSFEHDELLRRVLTQTLSEGQRNWTVTLRVHPDAVETARDALSDTNGAVLPQFIGVREVVADPNLPVGGCLLVSETGAMDISPETQITELLREISLPPIRDRVRLIS